MNVLETHSAFELDSTTKILVHQLAQAKVKQE